MDDAVSEKKKESISNGIELSRNKIKHMERNDIRRVFKKLGTSILLITINTRDHESARRNKLHRARRIIIDHDQLLSGVLKTALVSSVIIA